MRGYVYPYEIKEKVKTLRKQGFSLNELVKITGIPKTSVHDWVTDIVLSKKAQKRISQKITENALKLNGVRNYKRRFVPKPADWSHQLISTVCHFMFDGDVSSHSCSYSSRNKSQILRMRKLVTDIFLIEPIIKSQSGGVIRISYHYTDLAEYISFKSKELIIYIVNSIEEEQRTFLRAFFDDEGCVTFNKGRKQIRGYQHSYKMLKLIQDLLQNFGIKSQINNTKVEITITGKENLVKFQDEINFSPDIYINHLRKNSLWRNKISKSEILKRAIDSYEK